MKIYIMDLLPYGRRFSEFEASRYLPYPLPGKHFDREIAARTYEEHLEAWVELDRLGFDGVGLNEHHTTPHGLMNSPNMMLAAAAQRTKTLKFIVLGNLVTLHNPLRIAEELAMADCLSRGRVLSGFVRGLPREHNVFSVPMAESRARFEEAIDIILGLWTKDVLSYEGKFWSYRDISIWPRPYQEPHPPVWMGFTGSKETIEFAAERNFNAVLPAASEGLTEDIVGYFAQQLAKHGHTVRPDQICLFTDAWVADSRTSAIAEYSPWYLYFSQLLWHHGSINADGTDRSRPTGYVSASPFDYVRPENRASAILDRGKIRNMELPDIEARVHDGKVAWGSANDVVDRLIGLADRAGANSILLNLNLGALPHEMFIEQIQRFGRDVLPRLQEHEVVRVPPAESLTL